jgi:hypothetical protein
VSTDRPELPVALDALRVTGRDRPAPLARAAVTYARVSHSSQESLPVQLDRMRAYAAGLELPIVCECQDAESGLITTRKAYQTVRQLARSGAISHVILFHALVSNMEVRNISSHVLPAMVARAHAGHDLGRPPLGYRRTITPGVWEVHPDTAPAVREALERYAGGESLRSVTRWLNAALGLRKTESALAEVLGNPYYAGIRVYNRRRNSKIDGRYRKPRAEWVVTHHEQGLIDEETYGRIQERLATNPQTGRRQPAAPRFPLTGLVRCARCDTPMGGERTSGVGGKQWLYYICSACGRSKSNAKVETALRRLLATIPLDTEAGVARSAARTRTQGKRGLTQDTPAALERRLAVLDERVGRLLTLHLDGAITPVEYASARAQTLSERERVIAARLQHTALAPPVDMARAGVQRVARERLSQLASWLPALDDMTAAERNRLYRTCVTVLVLDCPTDMLTVHWQPWLAQHRGLADETVRLPRGRGSRPLRE